MAQTNQLLIRSSAETKQKFLELHDKLSKANPVGIKNYSDTLEALLKANASGSEKVLRVVELEAQMLNIDEAFRRAMKDNTKKLQAAQEKVNRSVSSRKAAHNKYHALIRHIKNNVPRQVLVNLNLSKFMEEPQQHIEPVPESPGLPSDSVRDELDRIRGGERE